MKCQGIIFGKFCFLLNKNNKLKLHVKLSFLIKCDKPELKGALSGLRQFLAIESHLKVMKNAFYFTSKALFVLKILKFLS